MFQLGRKSYTEDVFWEESEIVELFQTGQVLWKIVSPLYSSPHIISSLLIVMKSY